MKGAGAGGDQDAAELGDIGGFEDLPLLPDGAEPQGAFHRLCSSAEGPRAIGAAHDWRAASETSLRDGSHLGHAFALHICKHTREVFRCVEWPS